MHTNIHIMGVPGWGVRKNTWRSYGWKRLIYTFKKLNKLKVGKHKEIHPGNHTKNSEDEKKILKATKRKVTHHIQGDPTKISNSLPIRNNKAKTQWDDICNTEREKLSTGILYPENHLSKWWQNKDIAYPACCN